MARHDLTFRVFVSSTFTDMRTERRILQEEVFPRLKAFCEGKGASFQAVDLRWGVNEEAQLDQKTMEICLGEIVRCQRLSPKPNFIILLGDKYGWQPIPNKIPGSEMALIIKELQEEEKALIEHWYLEDRNAIPPEYVLQPRGDAYRLYADWEKLEGRLRNILRKAVGRLPFTEEQKVRYCASATHQEIMMGALTPPAGVINPEEHVFAYLRIMRDLPEDLRAKNYIDLAGDGRDVYAKAQLAKLREDLSGKLPAEHIYNYGAAWKNGCTIDDAQAFGARVYADLSAIIEDQLQEIEEVDSLAKEIQQHEEFKKERLEHFTGQKEALKAIQDYIEGPAKKVFTIIGASGTGKTTLMAKAIEQASDSKGVKVFRFIGTTSGTAGAFKLLLEVIRQIVREYDVEMSTLLKGGEDEKKFSTLKGLQEMFSRCLNLACKDKPLMIFLDALDQLSRDYASLSLDWLPQELPENVKIVVSALPELQAKLSHKELYKMQPMSVMDGTELLDKWFSSINRTLQPLQREEVINKFHANGTPFYLKLAFEKAKVWHSYSRDTVLTADIAGILDGFFDELEINHGAMLVQKFCCYLVSSKYQGLMEHEILGLMVFDREYWNHFLEHCHPDHREEVTEINKLPIVVWSRLSLDIEPYLTEREADGLSIISFYHRLFNEYANKRYLSGDVSTTYHHILADYFEEYPLYEDEKEQRPNVRKVVEQPYQEIMAEQWTDLTSQSLANFPFLMAKAKADMVEGIMEDYALLFAKAPQETKEKLILWEAFFRERAHILRRGNEEWPAYKILLQLAVEHADDSPLTLGAEQWLAEGKCDWVWLRRRRRLAHAVRSPYLAVFEGHRFQVVGAIETKDSRFISWADDSTLRLWDREGKPLAVLEGHTSEINGAIETRDGRFLSWAGDFPSEDSSLRLWDREGKLLAVLKGHTRNVEGAIETKDGRFLSWSKDKTLRLWNRKGKSLAVLEGHTGGAHGAIETKDGRFLSWSMDHTLRLWDREVKPLAILEGHSLEIKGALETREGYFLSWANDRTLRLWDREGKPLAVLEGHTSEINGAIETRDGRFLSWSMDHTLRLWDRNGKPLVILQGHTNSVGGALETRDRRFLSWAWDSTLRLWDREGEPLALLEGHIAYVNGAFETRDGCFLSWSLDSTLRLWNREGKPLVLFEGHTFGVYGAIETQDGRFLSWSLDSTLRLWNREIKPLALLEGHKFRVNGAIETRDGRFLSWADDSTLRLWDREGRALAVLRGHTHSVKGAIETKDGQFLSWSMDKTLQLWDQKGRPITIFEGHTGYVNGVLETKEGHFLSWAWDCTLRLWERNGKPLAVLQGHTDWIGGALETREGHFLSWANDRTLRLWDKEGKPLALLEGHTFGVHGAIETQDGRFLSWSDDSTLRLWDREGRSLAVLRGHTGGVDYAIETKDGQFLSRASNHTFKLWDREGQVLYSFTTDEGLRRFPESRIDDKGKKRNVSRTLFNHFGNSGRLTIFKKATVANLFWHGESECWARHLKPDGLAVLTQQNGQVCFLHLYHGNKQITIRDLEEMYGLEYQE